MTKSLRKSDWADLAALLVSAVAAALAPLQVFLFAYIFLGPFHYLTEMVWLRKKEFYFREGLVSARVYVGLAAVTTSLLLVQFFWKRDLQFWMIAPALLLSLSVWLRNRFALLAVGAAGLAVAFLVRTWVYFIAIMVPTLVHVFFFTWVFMVSGALRRQGRTVAQWINPSLVLVLPIVLLMLPMHYGQPGTFWLRAEAASFVQVHQKLSGDLHHTMQMNGTLLGDRVVAAVIRVFAFVYLFHYLNWFAKTELLQWHRITARMWGAVGVLYAASIGLYLWNIRLGFVLVNLLGLMHVLLEFPLDWHAMRFVLGRMRRRNADEKLRVEAAT